MILSIFISIFKWVWQNLIALDQQVNTFFFFGMADETLSARCWRNKDNSWWWASWRLIIDALFYIFERDHCYKAWLAEVNRKQLPKEYQ